MLIAARSLWDNSGPELTSVSDSLTVARKLLVAQDVAELVLSALLIELDGEFESNARIDSFEGIVGKIISKLKEGDTEKVRNSRRAVLKALNYRRVRFKHYGDVPEVSTTLPIIAQALDELDTLTKRAVGHALRDISAVVAVEHAQAATLLNNATRLLEEGHFRESLSSTARALCHAFWSSSLPYIRIGDPDTETALLLSGMGVDPASFLAMQRFLPEIGSPWDKEVKFDTRVYGHEENWNHEGARFCLQTALAVILRTQHAPPLPRAEEFYRVYEDVVTITSPGASILRIRSQYSTDDIAIKHTLETNLGDRYLGKVKGFYQLRESREDSLNFEMPLETAKFICLEDHNLMEDSTALVMMLGQTDELWFKAEDIQVTYEESQSWKLWKEILNRPLDESD